MDTHIEFSKGVEHPCTTDKVHGYKPAANWLPWLPGHTGKRAQDSAVSFLNHAATAALHSRLPIGVHLSMLATQGAATSHGAWRLDDLDDVEGSSARVWSLHHDFHIPFARDV